MEHPSSVVHILVIQGLGGNQILLSSDMIYEEHTVEKDVPKVDFSKRDKRTMSLVPAVYKQGTKG